MRCDPERARRLALQAGSLASATRYRLAYALATRALGRAALAIGDLEEAGRRLEEALQAFASIPCAYEAGRARTDLAAVAATREARTSAP